jgi:magnesium transporter
MKTDNLSKRVHSISFAGGKRLALFLELPEEQQAQVLLHLPKHLRTGLLSSLDNKKLVAIFNQLDPDEITDLIRLLPRKRQKKITQTFSENLKKSVELLSQFNPESAAGLMNLDYIQIDMEDKIRDVAKQFKIHEKRTGRLPAMFVMELGKFKGYLPGHELGFARPAEKIKTYVRKAPTIQHDASHEKVIKLFRAHPHNRIAVLGTKKNIIGVIYSDDILKALKKDGTSALYDFAGVHDEESVLDSTGLKVKHRYKWLIINLGTAFLAAFTVGLFDEIISKYVLLAVYMPIVAGMGGNAGTQTLAVLVRGIALKQINLQNAWPTLKREVGAGVVNGILNGIIVAAVVVLFSRDLRIAFVLGLAMVVNLFVAGFFGTLVPLIMKKFGKDPATSATIFITTATDVLGFLAFLGLATLILS